MRSFPQPFSSIAIPHKDILEGKLTLNVFAADLWEVFKGRAPEEYQNLDIFFRRTYITAGLKNLLDIAEKRLSGEGGDPVIQLQTPFGGGKTHSLIALYHRAKERGVRVVVIDGAALKPEERNIWEEIEFQLTGKIERLKGNIAPGKEKLKDLLSQFQPILILMDELLEYTTKAAGIVVGSSNLAAQTMAFLQEITTVIGTIEKALLIITLPSSSIEHYDENAEELFQKLSKIVGRVEKVYTPVRDEEISEVIRKRLFDKIDEQKARNIIEEFLDYAEEEKILEGEEKRNYREKFIKSFPFKPEVIDVLYKRWGSIPNFQRTRSVLRILALVVHSLKDSKISFIGLGDIDLNNDDIRRELVKHIEQEYDSIIAQDITSSDSGAKKVDRSLGSAYLPFSFGTRCATAIFMYSFSGGHEKGASDNEIKLACAVPPQPSSIVVEALQKLKDNLFYLSDTGLFFTNKPNLNRIILTKMENVEDTMLEEEEKKLLKVSFTDRHFKIYIWPKSSKDIPDTKELKLVVLKDKSMCKEFLENCGDKPRIYRNTLIFLCPLESERLNFNKSLRQKIALELIEKDKNIKVTDDQMKEIKNRIKKAQDEVKENARNLYRIILIPSKEKFTISTQTEGFKEIDLGIPTYGDINIGREVYEALGNEKEILEKLSHLTIENKYLKDKDYVEIKSILESFYKTPGEIRIANDDVFKECIKEGVKNGTFGVGRIKDGKPVCEYFKNLLAYQRRLAQLEDFSEDEIIIKPELCETKTEEEKSGQTSQLQELSRGEKQEDVLKTEAKTDEKSKLESQYEVTERQYYRRIHLKLQVPFGKLSDVAAMLRNLNNKFKQLSVRVEIDVQDGNISISEYEDKVLEALKQAGIDVEEEVE